MALARLAGRRELSNSSIHLTCIPPNTSPLPQACPLLSVTDPGDPVPHNVAPQGDLRTDIPKYCVYRDGKLEREVEDISALWTADMVGFLLGCSFSWEQALADAGLCPRHVTQGTNVPMYRTTVPNVQAGKFKGKLVVSMRPYKPSEVSAVAGITQRFPGAHGGPVHWGDPAALGLDPAALGAPHYGEAAAVGEGEVPVFWCCGVTPQTAIVEAALPLVLTHAPGHMFVCDILDTELKV